MSDTPSSTCTISNTKTAQQVAADDLKLLTNMTPEILQEQEGDWGFKYRFVINGIQNYESSSNSSHKTSIFSLIGVSALADYFDNMASPLSPIEEFRITTNDVGNNQGALIIEINKELDLSNHALLKMVQNRFHELEHHQISEDTSDAGMKRSAEHYRRSRLPGFVVSADYTAAKFKN